MDTKTMYYHDMKQAGFFTAKEQQTIEQYINLSDVIITYRSGVYSIASREITETFTDKTTFMEYVKTDLYWIIDSYKEMYHDREMDTRPAIG